MKRGENMTSDAILDELVKRLKREANSDLNPFKSKLTEAEKVEITKSYHASTILRFIEDLRRK